MEILLERIDKTINEVMDENLTMEMTEQEIANLIYEEESFIRSISSACPTSFLACC